MDWPWSDSAGRRPLIVAHRGASGLAPENTLAAFRLAIALGTPAIECDIHLSADGVPVVIHDPRVDRTTGGRGEVGRLTFDQLRRLDAGAWFAPQFAGERIPSLDDVLALCAAGSGRVRLFLELKPGGGPPLVDAALAALARAPRVPVAIISFDAAQVELVAQRRPAQPLGYLVSRRQLATSGEAALLAQTRRLGASFIAPQHEPVTAAFVAQARAAGLAVSVWTVDDPARMQQLAAHGVDAITTNRPDVALQCLRAEGERERVRDHS